MKNTLLDTVEKKEKAYLLLTFLKLIWPFWVIFGLIMFFVLLLLRKA